MHIDRKTSRVASGGIIALTLIGACAAATHPTAAAVLAAIQSSVTCATSAACVIGTNTGSGAGVSGTSKTSYGVVGTSTSNDGLKGISTSSNGVAGSSNSLAGVKWTSNSNYGVYGSTTAGLAGVAGFGPAGGNYGVYGYTAADPYGYAVFGYAPNGGFGMYGLTTSGNGVVGSAQTNGTGVSGISSGGVGVVGVSASGEGVRGSSNSYYGVAGATNSGQAAVLGQASGSTNSGVSGYNTSTAGGGYGVFGQTNGGGTGVYGTTQAGFGVVGMVTGQPALAGVYGNSNGYGVLGVSHSSAGLYGSSTSSSGVYGSSQTGDGVDAVSVSGAGLSATSTNGPAISATGSINATADFESDIHRCASDALCGLKVDGREGHIMLNFSFSDVSTLPIQIVNISTSREIFSVDSDGVVYSAGGFDSPVSTSRSTTVQTYSPKTASPTVEDSGTAELVNGAAAVRLDATFAATIDPHTTYRVFLTPNGDTNELYVPEKTIAGFIVREAKGGRSTGSFDYRILATELGKSGARMREVAVSALRPRALSGHQTSQPGAAAMLIHAPPHLALPPAPPAPHFTVPKVQPVKLPKPPPQLPPK